MITCPAPQSYVGAKYLGYLAALETDNSTPYFLNLHNGEVAYTLILGMTGSGKSYFCNFLLQNAQKYAPLTFIFDIGGSLAGFTGRGAIMQAPRLPGSNAGERKL